MELQNNQLNVLDNSSNGVKFKKPSSNFIQISKKSSNLVLSVLNSKQTDTSKLSARKLSGTRSIRNEESSAYSSTYDSNIDMKQTIDKLEGVNLNFAMKLQNNLNEKMQIGSIYCTNDSLCLDKNKFYDDLSKSFFTNENLPNELQNSRVGTIQGLMYGNNNFMLMDKGEYIFEDCIRILSFIAEGAQAKIYLGLIEEIDKYVAIKRMSIKYDAVLLEKIQAECEMVKNLEHPNILKYFDVEVTAEQDEERQYANDDDSPPSNCNIDIIMEYLDGMNIKELIKKEGKPSIDKIQLITTKILDGLVYLHENKIIHRDLKVILI